MCQQLHQVLRTIQTVALTVSLWGDVLWHLLHRGHAVTCLNQQWHARPTQTQGGWSQPTKASKQQEYPSNLLHLA